LIPVLAFAQSDTAHAYFKKGIEDELDFIAQKFIITKYASENNLIGQPSISFIINEAGRTEGFKIKESGGTEYDWELIRVIRTMKYRPAKINGQKISEWR